MWSLILLCLAAVTAVIGIVSDNKARIGERPFALGLNRKGLILLILASVGFVVGFGKEFADANSQLVREAKSKETIDTLRKELKEAKDEAAKSFTDVGRKLEVHSEIAKETAAAISSGQESVGFVVDPPLREVEKKQIAWGGGLEIEHMVGDVPDWFYHPTWQIYQVRLRGGISPLMAMAGDRLAFEIAELPDAEDDRSEKSYSQYRQKYQYGRVVQGKKKVAPFAVLAVGRHYYPLFEESGEITVRRVDQSSSSVSTSPIEVNVYAPGHPKRGVDVTIRNKH